MRPFRTWPFFMKAAATLGVGIPLALIALLFISTDYYCKMTTTEADTEKLTLLSQRYADYSFKLVCPDYVLVKQTSSKPLPTDEELEDIYRFFLFDAQTGAPRKSSYMLMNLYDKNNKFQHQIFYAGPAEGFVKEFKQEFR